MSTPSSNQPPIGQVLHPGTAVYVAGAEQTAQLEELAVQHGLRKVTSPGGSAAIIAANAEQGSGYGVDVPVFSIPEFLTWVGSHQLPSPATSSGPFLGFVENTPEPVPAMPPIQVTKVDPVLPGPPIVPGLTGAPVDTEPAIGQVPYNLQRYAPPQLRTGRPAGPQPWVGVPQNHTYYTPEVPTAYQGPPPVGLPAPMVGQRTGSSFHTRMFLLALGLLAGPFTIAVILEMANISSDPLIGVIIVCWFLLIIQLVAWPIIAINRKAKDPRSNN